MSINRRIFALTVMLLLQLLINGCSIEDSNNQKELQTAGSVFYEEAELSNGICDKWVSCIGMNNKNEVVAYLKDENKLVSIGQNHVISMDLDIRTDTFENVQLEFDTAGNIYVLGQDIIADDYKKIIQIKRQLIIFKAQGEYSEQNNTTKEIGEGYMPLKDEIIEKIKIDSKGNLYALKLSGYIEVFNNELESIDVHDKNRYADFDIDEHDNLIVLYRKQWNKNRIEKIDSNSGKTIWQEEYNGAAAPNYIYYNRNTKNLYGLNSKSIINIYKNSKVFDYSQISIVEHASLFLANENEDIYMLIHNGGTSTLKKYVRQHMKAGIINKQEQKELTVEITFDRSNIISNAARQFEKDNSSIKIKVVENDIPMSDYVKKLNTELLAGKGPDIFCTYLYDLSDCTREGLLVDYNELIGKDDTFDVNDYFSSILYGIKYGEGLYAIPLTYSFEGFLVNEKLLKDKGLTIDENWTWKDFYKIAKTFTNNDSNIQCYMLPKLTSTLVLLESQIIHDWDYYLNKGSKTARFDTDEFIDALHTYESIYDKGVMHPDIDEITIWQSAKGAGNEHILLMPVSYCSYFDIRFFGNIFNGNLKMMPEPKGNYTTSRMFTGKNISINNNSRNKDEAWQFVKYLLSEDVQKKWSVNSFVINKKASEAGINEIIKYQNQSKKENEHRITEMDIKQLDYIIENVLNKNRTSDAINRYLWSELRPFFDKQISAERMAEILQNKVELYLNE